MSAAEKEIEAFQKTMDDTFGVVLPDATDAAEAYEKAMQDVADATEGVADAAEDLAQAQQALSDFAGNLQSELATIGMTATEQDLYNIKQEYQDNLDQIAAIEKDIDVTQAGFNTVTTHLAAMEAILISMRDKTEIIVSQGGSSSTNYGPELLDDMLALYSEFKSPKLVLGEFGQQIVDIFNDVFHADPAQGGITYWSEFAKNNPDADLRKSIIEGNTQGRTMYDTGTYVDPVDEMLSAYGISSLSGIPNYIQSMIDVIPQSMGDSFKKLITQKGWGSDQFDFTGPAAYSQPVKTTTKITTANNAATELADAMFADSFAGFFNPIREEFDRLGNTDFENKLKDLNDWAFAAADSLKEYLEEGVIVQEELDAAREIGSAVYLARLGEITAQEQEMLKARKDAIAAEATSIFTGAFNSLQTGIDSIMGGSQMGVQSKDYFEGRYASLLAEAQADPKKIGAFTGFTDKFLGYMSDYGDPKITERVLEDLSTLQSAIPDMDTLADQITGGKTLAHLYDAYTSNFADTQQVESSVGFAGGGIISGPMSGYTIPTTFHGVEHITTDADMRDIKSLLKTLVNSGGQNGDTTQVRVFIGNKELKSITAEIVKTDPETQTQIRRVARV
jgi:hypothetical protein